MRPKVIESYRSKNFGNCLAADDYVVMKSMGLPVNTQSDWDQMGEASQKKEQLFTPLKSIERQLVAVLNNPNKAEMEHQLFPLLNTAKNGDGSVLLQNHLGDFGLELLLNPPAPAAPVPADAPVAPVAAKRACGYSWRRGYCQCPSIGASLFRVVNKRAELCAAGS